jgi:hypothetical protein
MAKTANKPPISLPYLHLPEKTVHIMKAPKGAFTRDDIAAIKNDFAKKGVNLIVVLYNSNSPREPQFDRMIVQVGPSRDE